MAEDHSGFFRNAKGTHRAQIMEKMEVSSLAELVRIAGKLSI